MHEAWSLRIWTDHEFPVLLQGVKTTVNTDWLPNGGVECPFKIWYTPSGGRAAVMLILGNMLPDIIYLRGRVSTSDLKIPMGKTPVALRKSGGQKSFWICFAVTIRMLQLQILETKDSWSRGSCGQNCGIIGVLTKSDKGNRCRWAKFVRHVVMKNCRWNWETELNTRR